jgi:hypothetical protein
MPAVGERGLSTRRLAIRVVMVSVSVGALAAVASRAAGDGMCAGPAPNSSFGVDTVCYQLVDTLSARVGLMSACITAIVVLAMVGLWRLGSEPNLRPVSPSDEERDR